MAKKEVRRMSRSEMLEMLIAQMEENESLRNQLIKTQAQLHNKVLEMLIAQLEENKELRAQLKVLPQPALEVKPFREKESASAAKLSELSALLEGELSAGAPAAATATAFSSLPISSVASASLETEMDILPVPEFSSSDTLDSSELSVELNALSQALKSSTAFSGEEEKMVSVPESISSPPDTPFVSAVEKEISAPLRESIPSPPDTPFVSAVEKEISVPLRESIPSPLDTPFVSAVEKEISVPLRESISSPLDTPFVSAVEKEISAPLRESIPSPLDTPFVSAVERQSTPPSTAASLYASLNSLYSGRKESPLPEASGYAAASSGFGLPAEKKEAAAPASAYSFPAAGPSGVGKKESPASPGVGSGLPSLSASRSMAPSERKLSTSAPPASPSGQAYSASAIWDQLRELALLVEERSKDI